MLQIEDDTDKKKKDVFVFCENMFHKFLIVNIEIDLCWILVCEIDFFLKLNILCLLRNIPKENVIFSRDQNCVHLCRRISE